jgi:agmatinase
MTSIRRVAFHDLEYSPDGRVGRRRSDVAVLGTPYDLGTSERPGARYGPDAIRRAPYLVGEPYHIPLQTPVFRYLKVVDAGDAEIVVASPEASFANIRAHARKVLDGTDAIVTLGGDHSVLIPTLDAVTQHHGSVTLIHLDAHPDIWDNGDVQTHATAVRWVLEHCPVEQCLQVGIRGYGPGAEEFEWARSHGASWWTMQDIEDVGLPTVIETIIARTEGRAYLSVDIDVADPAFAPGTGTPEPGGLTSRELLWTVRTLARHLDLVGMDVVEVAPPYDHADITAILANRCVMEFLAARAHRSRELN